MEGRERGGKGEHRGKILKHYAVTKYTYVISSMVIAILIIIDYVTLFCNHTHSLQTIPT